MDIPIRRSSSMYCKTLSRRNNAKLRLSDCFSDLRNRQSKPIPALFFSGKLFSPYSGKRVELGPASRLGHPPLGTDPAALLNPIDCRVKRSLLDLEQFIRQLPNSLDNAVAV